jgi:Tol biopolymer transport system component
MKMNNYWAAALSMTVGVGLVAGCGQSPTAPIQKAPAATTANAPAAADANFTGGGLAAQVVDTGTGTAGAVPAAGMPNATPNAPAAGGAPAAMPGTPTAGGGAGGAPMPGAPAPGAAVPAVPGVPGVGAVNAPVPAVAGTGVLGDTRLGGVVGAIPKALDRGLGFFAFGAGDLIAFQSNRAEGGGGGGKYYNYDIFVYDALAQTVLALPGVNTQANETNPRLSSDGSFLVYQTDESGYDQIRVFDLHNQLIDTLNTLNFAGSNQREPDISDDGNLIVYVSDQSGYGDQLRIYNTHNGANFIVPVANRGLHNITWPTISGNGAVIAYGACPKAGENREIFVYSVVDAAQLTPPFLNVGDSDNYNPDLNLLGDRIVFVSNRRGKEDIYMTDLKSGFTDNLVLANAYGRQQEPRFLGPDGARIVFQSDRTGYFRLYAYDLVTALLDTLPVSNEIGKDTQLRDTHPSIPVITHTNP